MPADRFQKSVMAELRRINISILALKKLIPYRPLSDWLDTREIIHSMNISRRTLLTLRKRKLLPFSRIKGKIFYRLSDVEQMLSSHYQNPKKDEEDKSNNQ